MRSIFLAIICNGLVGFGFAQNVNHTEELVRRVADNVIAHTSYQFVNAKTGAKYTTTHNVESTPDLKVESPYNKWFYPMGVLSISMVQLGKTLNDLKYSAYAAHNYDFVFSNRAYFEKLHNEQKKAEWDAFFAMNNLDACGALAAGLADVNTTAKRAEYTTYLNKVADFITHKQLRLTDHTLVRPEPRKNTLWADDLYMSVPFLARMGKITGDNRYFDDAILQIDNFNKYLYDQGIGLYLHCYYTDLAQQGVAHWGRCNGWLAMAQVELLSLLPADHPKRKHLLELLARQIAGFARYQDHSGLWHQLLDKNDSYLETSASAMFTYAVAKAVNEGWIAKTYIKIAQDGWEGIASKIDAEGRISDICVGTGTSEAIRFYYDRARPLNDTHGIGPVLLAGAEMIRYAQTEAKK